MKEFVDSKDLLTTVIAEAERNSATAQELVAGLNDKQLSWTPAPGSWSIAQCLDHLATTSREFAQYMTNAINRGQEKWRVSEPVTYRPTFVGGWLVKQVNPETGRNLPAPKVFRPGQSPAIPNAIDKFLEQQTEFLKLVRASKGIDYNKTRLRSPVTPLMRYSLADAFVVTVLHGRRHLAQAQRVKDSSGFPM